MHCVGCAQCASVEEDEGDDEGALGAGEMLIRGNVMDNESTHEQIDNACRMVVVRYGENYFVTALAKIAEREAAARPR